MEHCTITVRVPTIFVQLASGLNHSPKYLEFALETRKSAVAIYKLGLVLFELVPADKLVYLDFVRA